MDSNNLSAPELQLSVCVCVCVCVFRTSLACCSLTTWHLKYPTARPYQGRAEHSCVEIQLISGESSFSPHAESAPWRSNSRRTQQQNVSARQRGAARLKKDWIVWWFKPLQVLKLLNLFGGCWTDFPERLGQYCGRILSPATPHYQFNTHATSLPVTEHTQTEAAFF